MIIKPQLVGIVDAYSSGNYLAPEFRSRGFECAHIQSSLEIPFRFRPSFRPNDFATQVIHANNLNETIEYCRKLDLKCLIAGSETGVELADKLSELLKLPTNGTALSASRRDKFKMLTQVRSYGLRTIPSIKTRDRATALIWIEREAEWPVVIKPLRSAGTDFVTVCSSVEEFCEVFAKTVGEHDQFGTLIDEVLVQQKMDGREYIVDTVSRNGRHHVTNVWLIAKARYHNGDFVCEYNKLLEFGEAVELGLVEYACDVITALGIKNGPAHTEMILTGSGEPVLIESAARLHGAGFPIYSQGCVGYSQVDLTVDAYVDGRAFNRKSARPYQLAKKLMIVELISRCKGILKDIATEEVKRLPSFYAMKFNAKGGELVEKTCDVFTSPGHVVLMHENLDVIWSDYDQIRLYEESNRLFLFEQIKFFTPSV